LHYKRPGEITPLGAAAQKERSRDEAQSHGGYGGFGGMMGMHDDDVEDDGDTSYPSITPQLPVRKAKPKPDQEIVMMLVSMGFTENAAARSALACNNKGVSEAQEWAFQHMEDSNFNDEIKDDEPLTKEDETVTTPSLKKKAAVVVDPCVLEVLMGMGFSEQGCRRACISTNNNADASMEWILEHMGDENFNDPLPTEEGEEEAAAAKENKSAVDTTPKKEKGSEAGIKRDNSGEPKPGDSKPSNDQGAAVESEDAMVDDVETLTPAPVAPPAVAAAPVTTPNAMTSLTFDFSQFASGSTLPAPPTTGATAPPLDIGAMIAALSASAQASGSRPPASAASAPAATSSASSQAPPSVMKEDRALFVVADDKCVELVLSDAIVGDEESGGNRQLGFVFLYEVLTGSITLKLADKDVSRSLAEIMLR